MEQLHLNKIYKYLILLFCIQLMSCSKYVEEEAKKDMLKKFEELCLRYNLDTKDFTAAGFSEWDEEKKWVITGVWKYKKDPDTLIIIHANKDGWLDLAYDNFPPE